MANLEVGNYVNESDEEESTLVFDRSGMDAVMIVVDKS